MSKRSILLFGSKFIGGGSAYGGIEILWRGFTHISMIILGGICFMGLLYISKFDEVRFPRVSLQRAWRGADSPDSAAAYKFKLNMVSKSIMGGGMITIAELFAGIMLNIWLGLDVWDYSGERFQLLGQICLKYFFLWCGLSFIVVAGYRLAQLVLRSKTVREWPKST